MKKNQDVLTFGPIHALSTFMLVKGKLSLPPTQDEVEEVEVEIPQTGEVFNLLPVALLIFATLCGVSTLFRKKQELT